MPSGHRPTDLAETGIMMVGAFRDNALVGIGGVEVSCEHAELRRCHVVPAHRGTGAADAILGALVAEASLAGATVLRLETGVHQHAALQFYRRHGFRDVARFGPYAASAISTCLVREGESAS